MTAPRPSVYFNFANTPNYLDTRAQFLRNTIASFNNPNGQVSYVPVNAPRWTFDPSSGECLGIIIEPQKTNSAKYSQDFSNVIWTKTNCSVTVNSIVAPDATTTADTLISQAASGDAAQAITITSGQSIAFSVYAKSALTHFIKLKITDGTDTVNVWFNLSNGVVSSYTSGDGSCLHFYNYFETLANGWHRCGVVIRTTTNLSYTCSVSPTSGDGLESANTDSAYVWGAQIEAGGMVGVSSYIPTTASTVQRDSDCLYTTVSVAIDKWFSEKSGTVFFEWIHMAPANTATFVVGGIGDSFANTVYITKSSTNLNGTFIRNSVGGARSISANQGVGERIKAAATWASTATGFSIDGAVSRSSSAISYVPASTARFSIGHTPWSPPASSTGTHSFGIFRAAAYFPNTLSTEEISLLTDP